jgi:hypothetical protein
MGNTKLEGTGVKPTKKCSKCQTEKSLDSFCKHKNMKDGLNNNCKDCVKEYNNKNKQQIKEYKSKYYLENKEHFAHKDRKNHLMRKYGVTQEWYDEQLKLQDGGCKICGTKDPGKGLKHFHVDHSHETGKVRGLLCHSCNVGIGLFKEDIKLIQKAIEYVNRFKQD